MKGLKFIIAALAGLLMAGESYAVGTNSFLMPLAGVSYCAGATNESGSCYTSNATGVVSGVAYPDSLAMMRFGGDLINNAPQGQSFGTTPSGNPLLLGSYTDIPVASVNAAAGYQFISGVVGRTIYPAGNVTLMVSGTAAGATGIQIVCYPSLRIIGSVPILGLITSIPISPLTSTANGFKTGYGLTNGCASGDGVAASTYGAAMTTTTDVYVNMPYTVQ